MKARRKALVTGASSGIGAAFARHLARREHDVVLVARRKDRLDALASELSQGSGISAGVIAVDLASDEGVAIVERRLRSDEIHLLVNNAGFGTVGEFASLPLERELAELDLNVRALMRLSHAALAPMIERRSGAIINVASTAAFQPIPWNATYAATKAFVLHFSEALHEEAKPHSVTVTCLCPGPVKTEFGNVARMDTGGLPGAAWTSVDAVVEEALSAMRAGQAIAIPGALNKATAGASRFVPRFVSRRIAGAMFRGLGPAGKG